MTNGIEPECATLLIDVRLGGITRVAANRAKARAAAAFRFRTVDPLKRNLNQERDRGQSANRHERDGSCLTGRPFNFVRDEHSDSKSKRSARQREQIIERNLFNRFWNGYREGHRLFLYVSFAKKKRENLRAGVISAIGSF